MTKKYPFVLEPDFLADRVENLHSEFIDAKPFNHVAIDNFFSYEHARFLSNNFPKPDHPVWLDWKNRSPHQYGKLGPGNSDKFHMLEPEFKFALQEFNSSIFLQFLERLSGIAKLIPDPYYTGGGMHQILHGGILDVHTDFNDYARLDLFRQLNVIIYLNEEWEPGHGGEIELWDASRRNGGKRVKSIPPVFNRAVIFKTDKTSFHGHPKEWLAPPPITRRSIALYYYTARKFDGCEYTELTDFQGVNSKELPKS
ncbi:MAG: 2OG-Fe(II) oxygenase [Cyanobacteriota bacterium]|jgi:Rps23 Pro-64 3,4-dihydroxylase Tpa1-like proline 4-hydroxylase